MSIVLRTTNLGPPALTLGVPLLAMVIGGLLALTGSDSWMPLLLLGAAAAPLVLLGIVSSPAMAALILLATQPFEGYDVSTPMGSISAGMVVLALILLVWYRSIIESITTERAKPILVLVLLYMGLHIFTLLHTEVSVVARGMITFASYGVFWMVGCWLGRLRLYPYVAIGATIALLIMGLLGLGVSFGVVPPTERLTEEGRAILGLTSPLVRSYGTALPYDATALLASLSLPFLAWTLLRAGGERSHVRARVLAFLAVVALGAAFVFVFQSRNMVMQWLLSFAAITFVAGGTGRRLASLTVGGVITWVYLVPALRATDTVSSDLRLVGYQLAMDLMREDWRWVPAGIAQHDIFALYASRYPLVWDAGLRPGHQAIHNLFLNEFVNGGALVGVSLLVIVLIALRRSFRLNAPGASEGAPISLAASLIITLFVAQLEPISSNALGLWMLLGLVIGASTQPPGSDDHVDPADRTKVSSLGGRLGQVPASPDVRWSTSRP